MKNLTTALTTKFTALTGGVHNSLYTALGGRLYKGTAPDDAVFPYAVYMLISDVPEKTFSESMEDCLFQFSLFSENSSSSEIEDLYTNLKALYDECSLTITGNTLIWMKRQSAQLMIDEFTTASGTQKIWHYAVDYSILMAAN